MTQLVFVHGVSVRDKPGKQDYQERVKRRHKAFRDMGFGGGGVEFHDPYWGKFGAPPTYRSLDLNSDVALALGGPEDFADIAAALEAGDLSGTALLDAANADFAATVNSLSIILADPANPAGDPELALQLADYLVSLEDLQGIAAKPDWMYTPRPADDEAFLARLEEASRPADIQALGIGDALKKAGKWLLGKGIGLIDGPAARLARRLIPAVAVFLGDAFIYLKRGGANDQRFDQIRETVGDDLVVAATKARAGDEKLIVVGHSMGANILYDMLTDAALVQQLEGKIGSPLKIDLFLTVGTQLGLLQELGLFGNDEGNRPDSCARWWHVYNRMDVLSFGACGIFKDVDQFHSDTNANIADAHGAYFTSPVFQRRLYKRLKAEGLAT